MSKLWFMGLMDVKEAPCDGPRLLEACTQETAVWKSKSLSNYSVNAMKIKPKPLEMWICVCMLL